MIQDKTFTYEVDLQPDEKLTLPDSLIEQINAGRWKITFQPLHPTAESETMQPNGNGLPTDTNDHGNPMTSSPDPSPRKKIEELAAKQGVQPVTDINDLWGDVCPPDEDSGIPMTSSTEPSPREIVAALAAKQGVKPVTDINDLWGNFWPPDESVDTFIATVRKWRKE